MSMNIREPKEEDVKMTMLDAHWKLFEITSKESKALDEEHKDLLDWKNNEADLNKLEDRRRLEEWEEDFKNREESIDERMHLYNKVNGLPEIMSNQKFLNMSFRQIHHFIKNNSDVFEALRWGLENMQYEINDRRKAAGKPPISAQLIDEVQANLNDGAIAYDHNYGDVDRHIHIEAALKLVHESVPRTELTREITTSRTKKRLKPDSNQCWCEFFIAIDDLKTSDTFSKYLELKGDDTFTRKRSEDYLQVYKEVLQEQEFTKPRRGNGLKALEAFLIDYIGNDTTKADALLRAIHNSNNDWLIEWFRQVLGTAKEPKQKIDYAPKQEIVKRIHKKEGAFRGWLKIAKDEVSNITKQNNCNANEAQEIFYNAYKPDFEKYNRTLQQVQNSLRQK